MTRPAPRVLLVVARASGAGKTTLLESLVPRLAAAGLRVGAVKRTHHENDDDPPGSDTARLRAAGASPVLLAGPERVTLTCTHPAGLRDDVRALARLAADAAPDGLDLVVVEGGRALPDAPRVEVVAPGDAPVTSEASLLVAVVADDDVAPAGVPRFRRDDAEGLARVVIAWAARD